MLWDTMLRSLAGVGGVVALMLFAACGGSSTSDGSGGAGTGGSGACGPMPGGWDCPSCTGMTSPVCKNGSWTCPALSCGTGGTAGAGGLGGTAGSGACGPMPSPPTDCANPCTGSMELPVCQGESWGCEVHVCPDAGQDAASCASGQVPTVEGCLTCAAASQKLSDAIEAARLANASCSSPADCVMTGSNTTCWGSCGVAVSKAGEQAFAAALAKLDGDYCTAFVPECGYATPKCAQATLTCPAGTCVAQY